MNYNELNDRYMCSVCKNFFDTQRGLSVHLSRSSFCMDSSITFDINKKFIRQAAQTVMTPQINHEFNSSFDMNDTNLMDCNHNSEENVDDSQHDNTLNMTNKESQSLESGTLCKNTVLCYNNDLIHEVKLLKILGDLGTPLYAYNHILQWASDANMAKFNFDSKN